jgi:hypothetical protein
MLSVIRVPLNTTENPMTQVLKQTLASLCIAAAFIPAVNAQMPRGNEGRQPQGASGQRPFTLPSERIEARLAFIRTALKITDAQTPQWNAYADLRRRQAKEADQRIQAFRSQAQAQPGAQMQRPNAIERLERRQSMHAAAVTRLNEVLAVQKPLYAALSAEQRQIADRVLSGGPRGGMQRGMQRGMHRG